MSKNKAFSFEHSVNACYAELLDLKGESEKPSAEELAHVSNQAALLCLGEDAITQDIHDLSTKLSHPFSRLWMSGLLDSTSHIEWASRKQRAHATEQVANVLASKSY